MFSAPPGCAEELIDGDMLSLGYPRRAAALDLSRKALAAAATKRQTKKLRTSHACFAMKTQARVTPYGRPAANASVDVAFLNARNGDR